MVRHRQRPRPQPNPPTQPPAARCCAAPPSMPAFWLSALQFCIALSGCSVHLIGIARELIRTQQIGRRRQPGWRQPIGPPLPSGIAPTLRPYLFAISARCLPSCCLGCVSACVSHPLSHPFNLTQSGVGAASGCDAACTAQPVSAACACSARQPVTETAFMCGAQNRVAELVRLHWCGHLRRPFSAVHGLGPALSCPRGRLHAGCRAHVVSRAAAAGRRRHRRQDPQAGRRGTVGRRRRPGVGAGRNPACNIWQRTIHVVVVAVHDSVDHGLGQGACRGAAERGV